ncbi:hypothetical protein EDD15DRAFT_2371476 [Pisolithus albus]|nr:hypothetical protein EDD15DRAFT_2371476 [Pisolithus albus]
MVALTKINVELHLVGLKFLLDPTEGLNSIKTAWQLTQVTTNPLLADPAAWRLVLQWATNDNLSFTDLLTEMVGKIKDRYKFNEWKTNFDQVFKASHNGTTIEVVRAAMTEHSTLRRSAWSSSLPWSHLTRSP